MKEIEQEKYFQAIYEKELEDLHSKHANKMNNGSDAGFLRYKNSHSHIPPSNNKIFEEIKETEPQIDYKPINENKINNHNQIPDSVKCLEMQLLKERLAWERKMSEQELELKKLKLQMLEQQNDQKTTLQYLLKLQTDFTQQIANNNINIRRPITEPSQTPPETLLYQKQIEYNNNNNIVDYLSQSPQQSSYFPIPIQQITSNNSFYEEQKQESILVCVDNNEINEVLLDTESSFLIVSDEEENINITNNNNKQLNSSTQFELSSRPTTAIQIDAKKEEILSSYSSFGGNEQKKDDPFTVHVVVDDKINNKKKNIGRS
eukprot:366754_1